MKIILFIPSIDTLVSIVADRKVKMNISVGKIKIERSGRRVDGEVFAGSNELEILP